MLPISIAGSSPDRRAADGVAGDDLANVDGRVGEVAARGDPLQMGVRPVRAGDVHPAEIAGEGDRGVEQDLHLCADRADIARRPEPRLDLVGAGGAERLAERVLQLDLVDAVVAAHDHQPHLAGVEHHRECLERRSGGDPELGDERLDRGRSRGVDLLGRVARGGQLDRLRISGGDLDVGRIAGGERHVVLPGRARRHVLVGAVAAHHPDVRGDAIPLQAAAIAHPLIGAWRCARTGRRGPRRRDRRCRRPS